ncbi:MAG: hypothetical protein H0W43_04565 [Chthoniobacterales bacterium]|nr:hypothetical protein [Chthoniobacterales bacterium]
MERTLTSAKLRASLRGRQILLAFFLLALLIGGIALRQFAWRETTHLRFQRDIVNGFYWGSQTLAEGRRLSPEAEGDSWTTLTRGYFGLYDRVRESAYENDFHLDYPPLRLLVMAIWAKQVRAKFPGAEDGTPEYVEPLLKVNLVAELATALGVFLLVRLGVRRALGATDSGLLHRLPAVERGWVCGLLAASVAWLEPSLILDAHAWPQWDCWILPFYLFAALAALTRRWFWCGCLLAAGGMLKGQLLFVAPFFILWPLWQKRWARAGRVLAGFAATVALLVSPWLLQTPLAWAGAGAAGIGVAAFLRHRRSRNAWAWAAGLAGVAAFIIGAFGGGSYAWLQIGFLYGSERYPYLFISSCYNLPSLLSYWNLSLKEPIWSPQVGSLHFVFTLQWILRLLYLGALALCALGAARQARARDARLLIALATPWLLMFALLAQMHERYLLWGAVLSAVALGVSLRLTVVHFLFSIMSATMITQVLLMDKKLGPTLSTIDFLERMRPLASGLLLGCVAIYFREALSRRVPQFRAPRKVEEAQPAAPLTLAVAGKQA